MEKIIRFLAFSVLFVPLTGMADIAVIVNIENPTGHISEVDLKNIYRVRIARFPDGTPIILSYQPDNEERTRQFIEPVVGRTMTQLNRFWATRIFSGRMLRPINLKDDSLVLEWVAQNRNGIGYIDENNLTDAVKKIATIEPAPATTSLVTEQ